MQIDLTPQNPNVVSQVNIAQSKQESNQKATTVTPIENSSASFLKTLDSIVTQNNLKRIRGFSKFVKQFYMPQTKISLNDLVTYTDKGFTKVDVAKGTSINLNV